MPRRLLTTLILCCLPFFMTGTASADWLDKLKETAKDLTDKAGEALENAEPASTSDGEGQVKKPATTAAPAKPATPEPKAVAAPAAPAQPAVSGNNDKTLVRETQKELKRLGYSIGVDGAYGPNTKKQIIAFEQSQSLEPSGDASVELLAKLKATPTPGAEPAATAAAPAPKTAEPKAEPAPAPEKKAEPVKADVAAAPKESDYDRFYQYDGSAAELKGAWLIIRDKPGALGFYGEIKGDELITRQDLRSLKLGPDAKMSLRHLVSGPFRKTDSYDPPSVVILRFDGIEIRARNVSRGGSANLVFEAKGPEVAKLLNHLQDGNDFDYRLDHFEPFEYSKDWVAFRTPPPSIAAAKQAEKDKQAAAMAAEKEKQEKKAAYAGTLSPESKMAFENCEGHPSSRNFYSCQCIAEQTPAFVEAEAARKLDSTNKLIAIVEDSIKKNEANTQLPEKQKEYKNNALQEKLRQAKQTKTLLEAPSSSRDEATRRNLLQSAELHLYKEPTCKIGDGMRENEYAQCLKSSSSKNIKGKTAEEYCRCSADTVAKLWTSSTQSYSSKVAVSLPVQARTQCRK